MYRRVYKQDPIGDWQPIAVVEDTEIDTFIKGRDDILIFFPDIGIEPSQNLLKEIASRFEDFVADMFSSELDNLL